MDVAAVARVFMRKLRKTERTRLERAVAKSREPKFRDRCRAVLWSADGRSIQEIAGLLGVHGSTVWRWLADYRRFGVEGLEVEKPVGRARLLDEEGEAALEEALRHNPRDLGYAFTRWTLPTLVEYLYEAVHVRVSADTVRRALRRLGYRFKRPKLSLKHRQKPWRVRRAKAERRAALKKGQWTRDDTPSSTWTSASSTSIPA
jgi:transposase